MRLSGRSLFRTELDAVHPLEVGILRPEGGARGARGREDDGVRHGEPGLERESGGLERPFRGKVDDRALEHRVDGRQSARLIRYLAGALEDLVKRQGRDDELAGRLDRGGELAGVLAIAEVLESRRGVDDVHARSLSSRITRVSSPRRSIRR